MYAIYGDIWYHLPSTKTPVMLACTPYIRILWIIHDNTIIIYNHQSLARLEQIGKDAKVMGATHQPMPGLFSSKHFSSDGLQTDWDDLYRISCYLH